ncbi:hypothetical protein [Rhizobium sp. FY34]|uniref:hypothetical protein n=1 Tax=Rhizobium sp. FY34 TaxID=2562309 RepID=UPI0010C11766|nr:hypothetical protein [Rhizobium sp. FY34]
MPRRIKTLITSTGFRTQPAACRLLTTTALIAAGLSLSGCVSLLSKEARTKDDTASIAVADAADPVAKPEKAQTVGVRLMEGSARAGLYVDPMLTSAGKTAPPAQTQAHPPITARATSPRPKQQPGPSPAPEAAQAANLGELVTQPTAVQAGQNSIYALANAKVAEANGVSSYAPMRNINPIAGSVFTMRTAPSSEAAPAPAAGGTDGLW